MKFDIRKHYKGNLPWLADRTIFVTLAGSRAYGINTPESDWDYRGIAVSPKNYILGTYQKFEQAEFKGIDPKSGAEYEATIFDLRKFIQLAAEANPNICELLYMPEEYWETATPLYRKLHDNRHLFLSKKAKFSFSGYAVSQLKRAKTHRHYLLEPMKKEPKREDYGLSPSKADISKDQQGAYDELLAKGIIKETDFSENFLLTLQREKAYFQARREWEQYQNWLNTRNPKRKILEDKCHYDPKNAAHLVRLLKMAEEILSTGEVIVKRPDAEELKEIRNGAWSYDKIIAWSEEKEERMEELYNSCTILPHKPDYQKIDALCVELIEESIR